MQSPARPLKIIAVHAVLDLDMTAPPMKPFLSCAAIAAPHVQKSDIPSPMASEAHIRSNSNLR